jgi:hypothetical protein
MNILNLLSARSFLVVNKQLAKIVGLESAAMFADLAGSQLHWDSQNMLVDGYFYRTQSEIEEQTTLSPKMQLKCIKILESFGIVKTKLKGLPAVKHYAIDETCIAKLTNLISSKVESSFYQTDKLDSTNGLTIENRIIENNKIKNRIIEDSSFFEKSEKPVFSSDGLDSHGSKKEKSCAKKEKVYPFSQEVAAAFENYLQYRKEIKKPFKSERSLNTKIAQLAQQIQAYGEKAVIESIETAIANGWSGTFIDKKYTNKSKPAKVENKIETHDINRDQIHLLKSALMRAKIYDSRFDNMPDALALTEMQKALDNHKKQTT